MNAATIAGFLRHPIKTLQNLKSIGFTKEQAKTHIEISSEIIEKTTLPLNPI